MGLVADTGRVARFDFLESLRSRRVLALLLLYVAGAAGAAAIFATSLNRIFDRVLSTGFSLEQLAQSKQYLNMLSSLVGDIDTARMLMKVPPLATFYGWLAISFGPFLVVLTSNDAVAHEVASGSVRYALFRTGRLSWCLGKLAGQALMLTLGLGLGGISAYVVGSAVLDNSRWLAAAPWMLRFSGQAWCYAAAFLGLTMACSQLAKTRGGARALTLVVYFSVVLGAALLDTASLAFLRPLRWALPQAYLSYLWRPDWRDLLTAVLALLALSVAYFSLGYLRFRRRDV